MRDVDLEAALTGSIFTDDRTVCRLLNIPPRTAHRMLDRGILKGVKLGPLRRFYTAPLLEIAGLAADRQAA